VSDRVYAIRSGEPVKPQTPPPDRDVIELLQKLLALAEAGQLQALFAVGWNVDNTIGSGWAGAYKAAFTLLGGVHECLNEYLVKEFEHR
jgi:hypothetical protein